MLRREPSEGVAEVIRRYGEIVAAGVAGALVVLLAGCSGNGSGGGGGSEPTPSVGPLGAYFEKIGGSYDQDDAEEQARRYEEIVAECMAEQGFEYTPQDTSSMGMAVAEPVSTDNGMPAWDSLEYAQQYGYGATTWQDMPGATAEATAQEWTDPNQDYLDAMSDSERNAYYEALYGKQDQEPDENGVIEYDWTTAGCQGKASHEAYDAGNGAYDDPGYKALEDDLNTFYESYSTDPRMADIDAEWSDCIADAGYTFDTPTDAQQSIYDQMSKLYENADGKTGEPDEATMAELKKQELATATADRQCQIDVKYTQRQQEISLELEQQFVDEHKAELDALVAKYADQD
jgi:hypothetical protein